VLQQPQVISQGNDGVSDMFGQVTYPMGKSHTGLLVDTVPQTAYLTWVKVKECGVTSKDVL
jgi:hypothetical protein